MSLSKYLNPFFLFLSFLFNGLVLGAMIGSLFIPEGSGLAGPAIALGYGVIGTLIALVLAVVITIKSSKEWKIKWTWISSVVALVLFAYLFLRYMQKSNGGESQEAYGKIEQPIKKTVTADAGMVEMEEQADMGMGIARPIMNDGTIIYFYNRPEHNEMPETSRPVDSLTFARVNYSLDIATAPPWFVPEYMKMDYEILHLKVRTVSRFWIEVIGNKLDGKTVWMDRASVDFLFWPDFLLNVYSIELLHPQDYPLRIKPLNHASQVTHEAPLGYTVHRVKGEWLQVSVLKDDPQQKAETGWIRWKKDGRMLIRYQLLS